MTASTDYVPLLLNYFPLFVMIGDDLTCNHAEKLCLATFAASVGDPQIPGNRRILFLNI
jgi:hypothetical protein